MTCNITTTVEVVVEEMAKTMAPEDLMQIFCCCANKLAETRVDDENAERRRLALAFARNMSENAKRLLAEVFAADYIEKTNEHLDIPF